MSIAEIITELCAPPGPSGYESAASECARRLLEKHVDETWTDVLGNVFGVRRCGRENARRLMLDAHIDEIGLVITGVQDGFLRFDTSGGADPRMLPATEVRILSDPEIYGVVCALPPHVLKKDESGKVSKLEDMFIDIGMTEEEAKKTVPPGTYAVFSGGAAPFGSGGISGRALDDRAGFAAVIRALELLGGEVPGVDLYVMASVQEEAGVRGAITGAYQIAPDWCICVDVGHAATPDTKPFEAMTLGGGVIIAKGPNMNARFTDMIIRLAKEKEIKYQIEIEPGGNSGTNARAIQIAHEGSATALFSIPLKYMHSPNEVIELEDAENTARLLCETVKAMREDR